MCVWVCVCACIHKCKHAIPVLCTPQIDHEARFQIFSYLLVLAPSNQSEKSGGKNKDNKTIIIIYGEVTAPMAVTSMLKLKFK